MSVGVRRLLLSSKEVRFGGHGAGAPDGRGEWTLPGQCALFMARIEVEVLPPIEIADLGEDAGALAARVRTLLSDAVGR